MVKSSFRRKRRRDPVRVWLVVVEVAAKGVGGGGDVRVSVPTTKR